ncbi:molybdenum cofactor guanylyltransferase [Edaphobacter bradus]|uniref:molybdenum cofactor guanylyltransferase n=1 Tax=Edaphobacter bradus TaxID=2259016 RepID=UPI0021DFFD61|nr:molybdenum cofactor guanylyltransferase [Edaphobacter bradus]
MVWRVPSEIDGYVLAGGKSSRMGCDKALLEFAGKPLVLHAVVKLRRICTDVHILGNRPELDIYAPMVPDLREGVGPLGGIETAFAHSRRDWLLFMPVDMPFLPSSFLDQWVRMVVADASRGARVAMFTVDDVPQPALCLLHREVGPYVYRAAEERKYTLLPVLEGAAKELAGQQGVPLGRVLLNLPWGERGMFSITPGAGERESWWTPTEVQQAAKHLWFANLNTPEEFAEAKQRLDALDT